MRFDLHFLATTSRLLFSGEVRFTGDFTSLMLFAAQIAFASEAFHQEFRDLDCQHHFPDRPSSRL